MIRVNATIQITKDEIRIAINDNLIICIEIISSFIQRQQRVPHFCQHGDFPLSRITLRHPKSVINAKTAAPDYSDAAVKLLQMCDFGGILPTSTRIGTRWHTAQLFCIIIIQKTLQTRQTFELFSPKVSLSGIKFCSLHPASYRSVVRKIRIIAGFLKLFIIRLVSYWAVRFTRKVV